MMILHPKHKRHVSPNDPGTHVAALAMRIYATSFFPAFSYSNARSLSALTELSHLSGCQEADQTDRRWTYTLSGYRVFQCIPASASRASCSMLVGGILVAEERKEAR
jgi:hypothetical protein